MSQKKTKKSKIITFYSFKGGVGRSMALVNVATLLSSWGFKVLMVDWDLEAPGIENFFTNDTKSLDTSKQLGVLDLLEDLQSGKKTKWKDYVYSFSTKISKTPISLMTSGRVHEGYTDKLRAFNVGKFYTDHQGGYLLEEIRNEWLQTYDFVLIDSRTGVTDFGGICTIQMPDILIMLLTPTEQGLKGTIRIAKRAEEARRSLPFDREKLFVFPLPSRIDSTTEFEQGRLWVKRFAKEFEVFFDDWLPANINREDFLQRVKVPYIAYFSFGEKLPVIEQGMNDTAGLGYSYENLAMLIGNSLDNASIFWDNRGNYLEDLSGEKAKNGTTNTGAIKIFVSCVAEDLKTCYSLAEKLENSGKEYRLKVVFRNDDSFVGLSKSSLLRDLVFDSDIVIIWHTFDYAKKMFASEGPISKRGRDDIEIQAIQDYPEKTIIPVFIFPPIDPNVFESGPKTPYFILDRIGISLNSLTTKPSEVDINLISERIMPIVASIFQRKQLQTL